MEYSSNECRSHCPINFVLETFGDKWTLLVIRDLMFHGKQHFVEFLESDEGISTNILADRLRRLESHGVVEKREDPSHGSKVLYGLTAKGKDLLPVMLEITLWSGKHDEATNAPAAFLKEIKRDRARASRRVLAKIGDGEK